MLKRKKLDKTKSAMHLNYLESGELFINNSQKKKILSTLKSSKLKEIEILDYSIKNLQSQLIILRKMIEDKESILVKEKQQLVNSIKQDINPDILCQICFENRVNTVLTPCGHTFCSKCLGNTPLCFNCRTPIDNRFKIYFS